MKKILFILLIIATIFLFGSKNTSLAQNSEKPVTPETIEYDLPYPGMLPDHPLYIFKTFRDKLIPLLITSPEKKIQFYLLQADKGILSSSILIEKGNYSLADKTLLKAENYMTEITFLLFSLSEKPSKEFMDKLKLASQKHQEVIKMNFERIPSDKQQTFKTVLEFSQRNLDRIIQYEQETIK